MAELGVQDSGLECVQSAAVPNLLIYVSPAAPMEPVLAEFVADRLVIRQYHASVAICAEVLGGVKGQGDVAGICAKWLVVEFAADSLGGVPDQRQSVLFREIHKGVSIRHLAVKINGHYGSGF